MNKKIPYNPNTQKLKDKKFKKHLERASEIVANWPDWKKNILKQTNNSQNKEGRQLLNQNLDHLKNRPSWDETFFSLCIEVSKRSHDANTQHGCVLINQDNEIITTGYNGVIRNVDETQIPNVDKTKYPFFLHSEHNAILNCARQGKSSKGSIAYITGAPCEICLQSLYQAGIVEIRYAINHKTSMMTDKDRQNRIKFIKALIGSKMRFTPLPVDMVKRIAKEKNYNFYGD